MPEPDVVCALLRADHRAIEEHLDKLLATLFDLRSERIPEIQATVSQLQALAKLHFRKEEEIFYPKVSPLDPDRRMYLAAWGQGRADVDVGGGLYLTTDAGATWQPIFQRSQHVYDVTVDPKNPRVLYACGFDAAAWRSADAGATWQRIRGYTFKWGHRVVVDLVNPKMIYITTYGGSVWHGPAEPGQNVPEDVPSPVPVAR